MIVNIYMMTLLDVGGMDNIIGSHDHKIDDIEYITYGANFEHGGTLLHANEIAYESFFVDNIHGNTSERL